VRPRAEPQADPSPAGQARERPMAACRIAVRSIWELRTEGRPERARRAAEPLPEARRREADHPECRVGSHPSSRTWRSHRQQGDRARRRDRRGPARPALPHPGRLPAARRPERLPVALQLERLPAGRQSGHRRGPERRRARRAGVAQQAHRGPRVRDLPFRMSVTTITTAAERAMQAQRPEPRALERLVSERQASGYWGFSV